MPFDPNKPHNDLPLLPPKAELERKAVLRKAIAANKALAELKGLGERVFLNRQLLDLLRGQEERYVQEIGFFEYAALLGTSRICGTETFRARITQV
jgi:hypothetical protein